MQRREWHEIELQRQLSMNLLALLRRNPVPLVDGDDERAAALQRYTENARVLLRDRVMRIDHQDHHVRLIDRLQRLRDARPLDRHPRLWRGDACRRYR